MSRCTQFAALALSIVFLSSPALAEPQRGRLPDGRAYRIDSNGFQLMDHIAELEVSIEELKQQVLTLEDETIEKQGRIDKLVASGGADCRAARPALPAARNEAPVNCSAVVSPLQDRVATLEQQLQAAQKQAAQQQTARIVAPAPAAPVNCDSQTRPLYDQISTLQNALMSGPSKEEVVAQKDRNSSLSSNLQAVKSELSEKDERLADLSQQMQQAQKDLNQALDEVTKRTAREEELSRMVASLSAEVDGFKKGSADRARLAAREEIREEASEAKAEARETEPASEISLTSPQQLAAARASFQQQLSKIQSLISSRKDLIDQAKHDRSGVSLQISSLVSTDGQSLDNLRSSVSRLNEKSDVEGIQKGLVEIESKLREDIGILKRISKL